LLSPNYKKKDVVPPLTTQNYAVTFQSSAPYGYTSATTDADAVFQPLRIQDGESGSGGSALDFGGSGSDTINVDFSPEYVYKDSSISGYFVLYLTNNFLPAITNSSFLFRVRDYENSTTPPATYLSLSNYNYGWTAVNMVAEDSNSLYKVTLPFNLPKKLHHKLTVEIAPLNFIDAIADGQIRLNSAYIYYF
tara:strand:+ start:7806 stop:8381 length:576 start_codon:yes stop_codon:yes gene_type:complete